MNNISLLFACLLTGLLMAACGQQNNPHPDWSETRTAMEAEGQTILAKSRDALARQDYETARREVSQLRTRCKLAYDARNAGILLLDSIEIADAQSRLAEVRLQIEHTDTPSDSLQALQEELSMRVNFFKRKLTHDKNRQ